MTIIDSQAKRDHEFESAFLQRRVFCEPDSWDLGEPEPVFQRKSY
jgi:hypothetical protein